MSEKKNQQTEADSIWEEIKSKPLDIFGLPNQRVQDFCSVTTIEPSKLYLTIKAQAVLPALDTLLNRSFVVSKIDRWVTIERKKELGAI